MKRKKRLSIYLSVLLGSILITPLVIIGATAMSPTINTSVKPPKVLNDSIGNSVEEVGTTEIQNNVTAVNAAPIDKVLNISSPNNNIVFKVVVHLSKIAPMTVDMLPAVGVYWDNPKSKYATFSSSQKDLHYLIWTKDVTPAQNVANIAFAAQKPSGIYTDGYIPINFSTKTDSPTYASNGNIYKVLPSAINSNNFSTYINVIDWSKVTEGNLSWKPDDTNGALTIKGNYRITSYTYADKIINPFTFVLSGFAKLNPAPVITTNGSSKNILPSKIDASNYLQYVTVNDPSEISSIGSFKSEDSTGTLRFTVKYYNSTYHSGASISSQDYTITEFAKDNGTPNVATKSIAADVLPSTITASNYATYLSVSNPSAIKTAKSIAHDDTKGTLRMSMDYYTTTSHKSGAPSDTHVFDFTSGFANLILPSITINQNKINGVSEDDFASKIVDQDPVKTLDALSPYVTITNIKPDQIKSLQYYNSTLSISYNYTTSSHSKIVQTNQTINGFYIPSNGGLSPGDTALVICLSIIAILALIGLGGWYYFKKTKISKPILRGGPNRDLRLNASRKSNYPQNNSHLRINQNNPNYPNQRRHGSYPTSYGTQRSSLQSPIQTTSRHPTQARGRYPMQVTNQYPTQARGRYPMQAANQYPTQATRGNSRAGQSSSSNRNNSVGRGNAPRNSSRASKTRYR